MKILKSFILIVLFQPIFSSLNAQEFGFNEVQLTNNSFDNRYASYNKNGDRIVFESNRDGHWQIYTMDINGNNQKRLISSPSNDRRPTWHPYKNIVLFESDRSGTYEIYKIDIDADIITKIPISVKGNKSNAQYAPNGVQVIFNLEDKKGDFDIYIVSHKGKRQKKLVDDKFKNLYPRFSRKGDNITYFTDKNFQNESNVVYLFNIITKDRSRITYFMNNSQYAICSNKRGRIAYVTTLDDGNSEIYIMRTDGTHKTRITFNDYPDTLPIWSPNDINILISSKINGHDQIRKILLKEPLEEPKN